MINRGILAAYLLAGCALVWGYFLFTVDDTFISLRFSENLAQGLGPVFNPGERVEGFSNPLWVALFGLLAFLPGDLFLLSKLVSSAFYLACGWILLRQFIRRGEDPLPAALLYLASTPLVIWGVSGMETSLYALLLLLWAMAVSDADPGASRLLILATCLLLTRPEAPMPIGIGFAALAWRGRLSLRVAASFLLIAGALVAVRWAYYGDILPNTYYAKHFQTPGNWRVTLWNYVRNFYLGPGLIPLAGVAAFAWRFRDKTGIALSALALWPAVFSVLVGGDWMPQWRFLAVSLPVAIWLAGRAFNAWTASLGRPTALGLLSLPILAHLALGTLVGPAPVPLDFTPSMEKLHRMVNGGNPNYQKLVGALDTLAPGARNLAVGELGYFCYYVRVPCIDLHGLIDPYIAKSREYPNSVIGKKLPLADPGFPETGMGRYLRSRNPDIWILDGEETGGPTDTLFGGSYIRTATVGNFQIFRAVSP